MCPTRSIDRKSGFVTPKVCTDIPIYAVWTPCILTIHRTAAFPWNLYQVVIMGSELKDSGSSFLFWHVNAFPAQPWAFLNCQAWCFPKGLAGPMVEPAEPHESSLPVSVGVWWWWWWWFKGRTRDLEGSQDRTLSLCKLLEGTFSFWCSYLLEAVFNPLYCCVEVIGFLNLWTSVLWLSLW